MKMKVKPANVPTAVGTQVRKAPMSRRQTRLACIFFSNNTNERTYGVLTFIIRMELCNAVGILEKGRGQEEDSLLQKMSFLAVH